jgi:hypothetical protein
MAAATWPERALRPLDELRRITLKAFAGDGALGRALVRHRSVRVPVLLSAHVLVAFTLALCAPALLLAFAPLVFGVPHLAADVRHLLLRRSFPRWWLLACAGFALALVGLRAVAELRPALVSLPFEHAVSAAWVVVGAAGGVIAGSRRRWAGLAVLLGAAVLAAAAIIAPRPFRMALLHGHNLVALVVWALLFGRGWRLAWVPIALALAAGATLASGLLLNVTLDHGLLSVARVHLFAAADWLAPGLSDMAGVSVAVSFAFFQSVHYAIWLAGIPAADRAGDGGRSVRSAWRDLVRDLSPAGLALTVGLCVTVAAAGMVHVAVTRRLFLSLASFHGWLELAVLAYLLAGGPARIAPPSPAGHARP